jgi:hypothetical protein
VVYVAGIVARLEKQWRRRIANNVEILTVRAVPDGDE